MRSVLDSRRPPRETSARRRPRRRLRTSAGSARPTSPVRRVTARSGVQEPESASRPAGRRGRARCGRCAALLPQLPSRPARLPSTAYCSVRGRSAVLMWRGTPAARRARRSTGRCGPTVRQIMAMSPHRTFSRRWARRNTSAAMAASAEILSARRMVGCGACAPLRAAVSSRCC